jgi:hypothetical protein
MAAAVCYKSVKDTLAAGADEQGRPGPILGDESSNQQTRSLPINFLYGHLHNSIRTELDNLSQWVLSLEADNEEDLQQRLQHLKERYHFLEQVYKYHSSVEDEVIAQSKLSAPAWRLLVLCSCLKPTYAAMLLLCAGGVPGTGLQGEECDFSIQCGASG